MKSSGIISADSDNDNAVGADVVVVVTTRNDGDTKAEDLAAGEKHHHTQEKIANSNGDGKKDRSLDGEIEMKVDGSERDKGIHHDDVLNLKWSLPFNLALESRAPHGITVGACGCKHWLRACLGSMNTRAGMCVQSYLCPGGTHKGSLAYAYDFALPVGSPIVAARPGVIVACEERFTKGGVSKILKARANFVVIRHACGVYSRYYHLDSHGVTVAVGDHVDAGDLIGYSGNTGFTSGPHLHFDVVDCIKSRVFVLKDARGNALLCAPAGFSAHLEATQDAPLRGKLCMADPLTADRSLLNNREDIKGAMVLARRCRNVDFFDKARRIEDAGGIAAIIVNYEDRDVVHSMALPKARCLPSDTRLRIPVLMISKGAGAHLEEVIREGREGHAATLFINPEFTLRPEHPAARAKLSKGHSLYTSLTIGPVRFHGEGAGPKGWLPVEGRTPPSSMMYHHD
eukprot:g4225.t1